MSKSALDALYGKASGILEEQQHDRWKSSKHSLYYSPKNVIDKDLLTVNGHRYVAAYLFMLHCLFVVIPPQTTAER